MLKKVLIANRGEIACRLARTARRLGIAAVAVASEADAASPHVAACDEHVIIGPASAAESYLDGNRIIAAARSTGADCVHPGYGFLAENPDFAQACADAELIFIGPTAEAMRRLGDKAKARALARRLGIPIVPGDDGPQQDETALAEAARRIGFPLMIKAAAGGGGRGMRPVLRGEDFAEALASAQREAEAAFGDGRVLLEKLVAPARHVEVQVFGDERGNVVHLFERECSLQRRHQKVMEEAPAPGIAQELRAQLTAAAIALARAVGYVGAGTVEFLVEGGTLAADAPWYFIEANTRLQVEHPVTEAITGLDLVEWQFRIAAGEPLPSPQEEIRPLPLHAIEARLTAEDPARGFLPSTGTIVAWQVPEGEDVRIDTGVGEGSVVTGHYDSLLAKIIATGTSRETALDRLAAALSASVVMGPRTNAAFLRALARDADVRAGRLYTGLLARKLAALAPETHAPTPRALAAGVAALLRDAREQGPAHAQPSPWDAMDAFQLGGTRCVALAVSIDGRSETVQAAWPDGRLEVGRGGEVRHSVPPADAVPTRVADGRAYVLDELRQFVLAWPEWEQGGAAPSEDADAIRSPITGRIAKIHGREGDRVARGDAIAVVEAMKMEHIVHAGRDGLIARVRVETGEQVAQGALLLELAHEAQDEPRS